MEKQILHIDVNNAFLSWTAVYMLKQGSKIDIREIPAIIGGDESKRSGIVLAKSMKAKECGIKTAETIYQARIKCPNLQIFKADFKVYRKYSDDLYNLLLQYTDKIERFSIDECFLDMTNYLMKNTLLNKAEEISKRIKEELGFTVNIGVANNKLLAKMASDFTKPDRIHTLYKEEIPKKMWTLPVSELFMLGKKTVPKLYNLQIKTIGDLAKANREMLEKKFGKHGIMMWEYANGIDNTEVKYKKESPKGIGNSITLPQNISDIKKLEEVLLALTEQVTYRLRKYNLLANTVNVQLRTKDFVNTSHQGKLIVATATTKEIYNKAKELLVQMYQKGSAIRLIGVRVDDLIRKEEQQLSLFKDEQNEKQEKLDKAIDELKEKYGYNSITRAGKMNVGNILKLKDIE
jgi:DNA polymerase-4